MRHPGAATLDQGDCAGVVPIGPTFGVLYAALVQLRVTYVNAGLNLAASGNMVDVHGKQ